MKPQLLEYSGGLTTKALFVAATALSALWLSLLFESPQLLILSIVMALYFAFHRLIFPVKTYGIKSRYELNRNKLYEGGEVHFEGTITNNLPFYGLVEVLDQIPTDIRVSQGGNHYFLHLHPESEQKIKYKLVCEQKGLYLVNPTKLRVSDPAGLVSYEIHTQGAQFLKVMPIAEDVRGIRLAPKALQLQFGTASSKRPGIGTEFFGLRGYLPGDEFRRINWKASARMRSLVSNEYEWEQIVDAYILLDATTSSIRTFTASVRAAASIANYLVRGRNRVGLVTFSDAMRYLAPESGGRQLMKIIDKLIDVKMGEPAVFEAQILSTTRLLSPNSFVILISPLLNDKIMELADVLLALDVSLTVVSPSPLAEEPQVPVIESIRELSEQILSMKRENVVRSLTERGIQVLDWDPRTTLRTAMGVLVKRAVHT